MFLALLAVTFVAAATVSALVMRTFTPPIGKILDRIISDDISGAWLKYVRFAILVVGISAGVRIHELERYITPRERGDRQIEMLVLNTDRWVLELYRTVIETLEGIAWMLLWFFAVALIAYVLVRVFELKRARVDERGAGGT
jgi:hypothetical protein